MLGFKKDKKRTTGSLGSAPTFSYYRGQTRPTQQSDKAKLKRPMLTGSKKYWTLAPSLLALIACLVVFVYSLMLTPTPILRLSGQNFYRPEQDYQTGVEKILKSSLLYRSKITFNSREIEEKILSTYPELTDAAVAIPLAGRSPVIGLNFAKPTLRFVSNGNQMVLDETGKVLPLHEGGKNLPIVTDESGIDYEPGNRALSASEVSAITFSHKEAKAHDRTIAAIKIGLNPREFQIQFEGDVYFVKLSLDNSIREQMGALWATQARLQGEGSAPKSYIDVRLAERVFVL